ncbi:hypothetical protein Ddc_16108 [Ditylenchus destructor]|nr:hypothetical protein Ddc_16108 [Ditylenchus destructor]
MKPIIPTVALSFFLLFNSEIPVNARHLIKRRQTSTNPCLSGTIAGTNQTSSNVMVNFHSSESSPGSSEASSGQVVFSGPTAQNSVTLDTADGGNFLNGNCCYSNGMIYDANGTQTSATNAQRQQLTQYRTAWNQWFNQQMNQQFSAGFPINNAPGTLPSAVPQPQAPCFCAHC